MDKNLNYAKMPMDFKLNRKKVIELSGGNLMNTFRKILLVIFLLSSGLFSTVAQADITSEEELNKFVTHYYQNPQPNQIPQAVKYFISSAEFKRYMQTNQHLVEMLAYFFGRVAELSPKLRRDYEKMYDKADEKSKVFFWKIFSVYRDPTTEKFFKAKMNADPTQKVVLQNMLNQPLKGKQFFVKDVQGLNQLDFLWMEFFATGSREPIQKIIDVLNWKDIFRNKLQDWLLTSHTQEDKDRLSQLSRNDLKVNVEVDRARINYFGDMDCLYFSFIRTSSFHQPAKVGIEFKQILGLSDKDFVYIITKGAAFLGLLSNAQKHPKVLEFCNQELKSRKDKSNAELQNIVNAAGTAKKRIRL